MSLPSAQSPSQGSERGPDMERTSGGSERGPSDSGASAQRSGNFAMPKAMVCFALAGRNYGLDVTIIREVVNVERLLPVPKAPAPIAGAFALRGATLALVDTRTLFGLVSPSERNQALIVARGHRVLCALTIDSVMGVVPFEATKFTAAIRGQDPAQVAGFFGGEQHATITVLDTRYLLQSLDRLRF
jgi:purine-binding chemotaxis protein CheW